MAPLLVPLLLSLLFYSFSQDIVPDARKVIGRTVPNVLLQTDEGKTLRLKDLAEGKPLLLSFIYTRCTSACPMIVRGIREAVSGLEERDFKVVLIDFDERDTLGELREFRARRGIEEGWVLALVKGEDLGRLTSSLDFKFFYEEKTDMFAHPNVLVVLTPDLRVSSYFLGVSYDSSELAEAVDRAYAGELKLNPIRSLILKCFRYDPITGAYTVDWSFIAMVVGGLIPLLGMAYFLFLRDVISGLRRAVS
jgi:protein SCO1/2